MERKFGINILLKEINPRNKEDVEHASHTNSPRTQRMFTSTLLKTSKQMVSLPRIKKISNQSSPMTTLKSLMEKHPWNHVINAHSTKNETQMENVKSINA